MFTCRNCGGGDRVHVAIYRLFGVSEGRFDLCTFRSERTNEASTLTITPKRSSSRDVGTSSYKYHTATGEFRRAKSHCHLYGAQGQRQAYLLPMPR
ncbi:hypothetical protein TNCV_4477871 [Trichonephila clavipes]|nr:hypothetical protein TNCV_4477871 [Trichonephila clavipes]